MKWLVYLLLAANAALFAWGLRHLEPPPPRPLAAPAGPAMVNRLLLLDEVEPGELRERAPPAPAPVAVVGAEAGDSASSAASTALCLTVGPLDEGEQADQVRGWLEGEGGTAALRVGERRELSLYWIYFPPVSSRGEAVERVGQMRGEGIEDIYIIPRGDMANAISLGVYSRRTSLDRRLAELRAKGYDPSIVPRYRNRKATWIDAAFRTPDAFPRKRFGVEFAAVEFQQVQCRSEQIAALAAPAYNAEEVPAPVPTEGASVAEAVAEPGSGAASPPRYFRSEALGTARDPGTSGIPEPIDPVF